METVLFLIILIVMWIFLSRNIRKMADNTEALKKEIENLRKYIQQNKTINTQAPVSSPVPSPEPQKATQAPAPVSVTSKSVNIAPPVETIRTVQPVKPDVVPKPIEVPKKKHKTINYEKLIGENLFGKIGILILIVGMGLFVKYAIDNEWINETMRTILGFLVGSSLLFIAQRLNKQYRTFSSLLAGGAFAMFYVTTAIAFHYYELFSQTTAFIILVVTTIFMAIVALLYNRRELAIIALTGGFLAPFLISTGNGSYITLFTYIFILNSGMFALSIYKKWKELPLISFAFTWICAGIYMATNEVNTYTAIPLLLFCTAFYLQFLLPVVYILKSNSPGMNRMLLISLITNNFIYMGLGIWLLNEMNYEIKTSGLLTLSIALVNLIVAAWLRKTLNENKNLLFTLLGCTVTFVSVTVPLQLEGNYITIFWASEMILLLWLFYKSSLRIFNYFSFILLALTLISWFMDIRTILAERSYNEYVYLNEHIPSSVTTTTMFLNRMFVTSLFVSAAFLCYALLIRRYKNFPVNKVLVRYIPFNTIAIFTGAFIGWYAFDFEFYTYIADTALQSYIRLLFASGSIFTVTLLLQKRFPAPNYMIGYLIAAALNIVLYLSAFFMADTPPSYIAFLWFIWGIVITHIAWISYRYYVQYKNMPQAISTYNILLNITGTLLLLTATYSFMEQTGIADQFSSGFSVCLTIIGFVQMSLGMRLHIRQFRIISLITFGIILSKLILIDLWLLPTVGKIIVFIILGIILLLLSFMYQKLKNILFKDTQNEK